MTNTTPEENGWEACPPGKLVEYARRTTAARRNRAVLRLAGEIGAAIGLFLLVVWLSPWGNRPREFDFGGITCSEVKTEMQQYMMGGLEPEEHEKIRLHLAHCPRCQELLKKMQGANAAIEGASLYESTAADSGGRESTGATNLFWKPREWRRIDGTAGRVAALDSPNVAVSE